MCGYIFSYNRDEDILERKVQGQKSLTLINHRGPDQSNLYITDDVLIGHCRLSIIDVEGSIQPMCDPTNRFHLAFNGEIYNYKQIRKILEKEWQFKTKGDTEVILATLALKKEYLLRTMEGMWSYVFWDNEEKKLLISRDRMGKKPAYYSFQKDGIVVASELSALINLINDDVTEDFDSTADYFKYGYYLPGTTAYKGIREVLPGHIATWSPYDNFHQESFWELTLNSFRGNKSDADKKIRQILINATKKRMIADVEVGAFLSGGVDSSLIVSIMNNDLNIKPKTFTIGFSDHDYDERNYARKISESCSTDHYEEVLSNFEIDDLNELILNHVGQPFSDSSILPTALVSKLASKYVKVALSGDGGDELFCGYQRYQARAILRWYTRLPKILRKNVDKIVKLIPEPFTHHSSSLVKKAHLFLDITKRIDAETPYIAPVMYAKNEYKELVPDLVKCGHDPVNLREESSLDDIKRMMYADALVYLPQDILLKVDRASMAHSLETRAPFLDSALVEFAFSLPTGWHKGALKGKKILRSAFKCHLPNNIWNRRKQGFAVPVHNWFRKGLSDELVNMSHYIESPIRIEFLKKLIHEHKFGARDNGYRLWSLYTYYLWKSQSTKPVS